MIINIICFFWYEKWLIAITHVFEITVIVWKIYSVNYLLHHLPIFIIKSPLILSTCTYTLGILTSWMLLHYCTIIQIFQIYFPSTYTRQLSYAALLVTSIWGFREVDFINPHKQQHTSDHVHIYLVTDKENDIRDKEITQKVWPQSVVSLSLSLCPSNL